MPHARHVQAGEAHGVAALVDDARPLGVQPAGDAVHIAGAGDDRADRR
jgi:hypothetical protein